MKNFVFLVIPMWLCHFQIFGSDFKETPTTQRGLLEIEKVDGEPKNLPDLEKFMKNYLPFRVSIDSSGQKLFAFNTYKVMLSSLPLQPWNYGYDVQISSQEIFVTIGPNRFAIVPIWEQILEAISQKNLTELQLCAILETKMMSNKSQPLSTLFLKHFGLD